MPAKKRKPKWTDGVLCRDGAGEYYIAFAPGVRRSGVQCSNGLWVGRTEGGWQSWTLADWKASYDLAPPRKGQCFECEVEL